MLLWIADWPAPVRRMIRQMAERTVRKMKSLRWKLLSVLVLSMLIALAAFILYFYSSARKDAMHRFEQQTNASIDLFADSLDYYTNNCIDAVKSVYQNRDLLNLILLGSEGIQTSGKRAEMRSTKTCLQTSRCCVASSSRLTASCCAICSRALRALA